MITLSSIANTLGMKSEPDLLKKLDFPAVSNPKKIGLIQFNRLYLVTE